MLRLERGWCGPKRRKGGLSENGRFHPPERSETAMTRDGSRGVPYRRIVVPDPDPTRSRTGFSSVCSRDGTTVSLRVVVYLLLIFLFSEITVNHP